MEKEERLKNESLTQYALREKSHQEYLDNVYIDADPQM